MSLLMVVPQFRFVGWLADESKRGGDRQRGKIDKTERTGSYNQAIAIRPSPPPKKIVTTIA